MAEEEYELFLSEKLATFLPFHEVIIERFFPTLFIQWDTTETRCLLLILLKPLITVILIKLIKDVLSKL